MAHHHEHSHLGSHATPVARRKALTAALALTLGYTVVEIVAGLLTGSLALLADAGHMVSDNVSPALALAAVWLSGRPATPQRSFGFKRAEVLAALGNGVVLVAVAVWIFMEAAQRFRDPPPVLGGWMLAVAAAVILTTGWLYADAVAGVLIAVLILGSSWAVLCDSVRILLEAAPAGVDVAAVERRLLELPGITGVHDLHVWTIISGFPSLSAHLVVEETADVALCRSAAAELLHDAFDLEHSTLQMEVDGEQPECTLLACGR